jgi:hypothetical protein
VKKNDKVKYFAEDDLRRTEPYDRAKECNDWRKQIEEEEKAAEKEYLEIAEHFFGQDS